MPLPEDWAEEDLMCGVRAKVTVERQFKGAPVKSVFIVTGRGWGDCGFPFKQGERYLLFMYEDGTRYRTNVCTRSKPVEMAAEDLATIEALVGKGATP
jgi:hypothetical protein